jgi:hypothetical protein
MSQEEKAMITGYFFAKLNSLTYSRFGITSLVPEVPHDKTLLSGAERASHYLYCNCASVQKTGWKYSDLFLLGFK